MNLNPEQEAAAHHGAGHALVLAGPGTGKTATLVGRYSHLVQSGVPPRRIFVSTFTRQAATELKVRIRASIAQDTENIRVGTFHSYCYQLAGSTGLISEPGRFAILRRCLPDWKGDLRSVLDAIDRFKDSLVTPDEALASAKLAVASERPERIRDAKAYTAYQQSLEREELLDFGSLVWNAIEQLRQAIPLGDQFSHLLIDEYQDINAAQHALIEALLGAGGQLWVVGDDDQAIYGWRGSDVRFISRFSDHYASASTYRLRRNYRSSPVILSVAQSLVRNNPDRLTKDLVAASGVTSRPVCLVQCSDADQEARWVSEAVTKLLRAGTDAREIAILVRTNMQTLEFENALHRAGVKFVVRGGGTFWKLPVVQALMSAIWRRRGPSGPPPWAGPRYLTKALNNVAECDSFPEFVEALAWAAIEARPRSLPVEKRIQWDDAATRMSEEASRFRGADRFLTHCQEATSRAQETVDEADSIVLSTVHQAKGLEWDAVFIAGCENELFPHKSSGSIHEERRLAYVASTRARRYLTVTWATHRWKATRDQSPFVAELASGTTPDLLDRRRLAVTPPKPRPAKRKPRKRQSKTNEFGATKRRTKKRVIRVRHAQFGDGTVVSVTGKKYVVDFDDVGRKKVVSRFLTMLPRS